MMRSFLYVLLLLVAPSFFYKGLAQSAGTQVIGAAGGTSKALSGFTVDFTIGETAILTAGTDPSCTQGFHQPSTARDFPPPVIPPPGWYVKVYPNPIHDQLMIHAYMDQAGDLDLRLLDMVGRTLVTRRLSLLQGFNDATIYVGALARGAYVLYFSDLLHGGHREVKLLKM